jgi:MinD-like ATPase involved in chromosome partitioning or flagellar assembly
VHRALGLDVSAGLADYLLEDTPIERILLHPEGIERFLVLPGGRPLAGSAELLSSPRMTHLADELKHRYPSRIVLFDLPPMTTSDTMAFLPRVDAVVLVAQEGGTTEAELQQAIAHLGQAPLLGTVLNQAEGDR